MVGNSKCCVPYCGHVQSRNTACMYASFPKDINRCRAWVRVAGIEDFVDLPVERLNSLRHVCGCHFERNQFSNDKCNRLKRTAIPTLVDERVIPLTDELLKSFPPKRDCIAALSSQDLISTDQIVAVCAPNISEKVTSAIEKADELRSEIFAIPVASSAPMDVIAGGSIDEGLMNSEIAESVALSEGNPEQVSLNCTTQVPPKASKTERYRPSGITTSETKGLNHSLFSTPCALETQPNMKKMEFNKMGGLRKAEIMDRKHYRYLGNPPTKKIRSEGSIVRDTNVSRYGDHASIEYDQFMIKISDSLKAMSPRTKQTAMLELYSIISKYGTTDIQGDD